MSDNKNAQQDEPLMHKIKLLERFSHVNKQKADDAYSLGLLQPLLVGFPFVPFTGSSLRPFCLNHMINDIIINQRLTIIEFGSGVSTIIIGRMIKKNKLGATILSIEHNQEWAAVLKKWLQAEQLDDIVSVVVAPLKQCHLAVNGNDWYDLEPLDQATKNKNFDMVIIDGPPAWEKSKSMARYPALPYIKEKLSGSYAVYLDDANREGEQSIIELWKKKYSIEFKLTGDTLAYHYQGRSLYTEPFAYY
jgi:hypothetical protein